MAPAIDWEPPKPRTSYLGGGWDQFVGPEATTAEVVIQLGGALVGGLFCLLDYKSNNENASPLQSLLVLLLAIDMVGGSVTNATSAAKRWYHRSDQTAWNHLGFVSIHALQIGLVATQSPDPLVFFALTYAYIMAASAVILFGTPLYLQRPVAMLFAVCAVPLSSLLKDEFIPTGMEWFVPMLTVKLLVAHLLKEAPFQPDANNKTKKS